MKGENDQWNLKPRGPLWLPEIVRMTWFLQVCGMVMGIHSSIDVPSHAISAAAACHDFACMNRPKIGLKMALLLRII